MSSWTEAGLQETARRAEQEQRQRENDEAHERWREQTLTMHASLLRQADCEPLRAVIGFHAPDVDHWWWGWDEAACLGCSGSEETVEWPCATIKLIQDCT